MCQSNLLRRANAGSTVRLSATTAAAAAVSLQQKRPAKFVFEEAIVRLRYRLSLPEALDCVVRACVCVSLSVTVSQRLSPCVSDACSVSLFSLPLASLTQSRRL